MLPDDAGMASLLNHDLRAAISDIIGGLRLISHAALDEPTRLQLERVRAASEALARLLSDGFEQVPGDDGALGGSNLQIGRFLYDLEMRWAGRAREKGLNFHIALAADVPKVVSVDRTALDRVLSNILANAIKYTDFGAVRMVVSTNDTEQLLFSIHDQGPGFSPGALDRLFERNGHPDDAEKPGHGMGMYISKQLTGKLGGQISVRNLPDGGAEVLFDLPLKGVPCDPDAAARAPLPNLSHLKVLVAEDSETNQAVIGHMLAQMGAQFETAADGIAALDWLERENFDLALIDIEMPRLSGLEVMRALRGQAHLRRDMPVVAVTAYVLRANRDAIYTAGADAIVAKPLTDIETFGEAIARALRRSTAEPAASATAAQDALELNQATFDRLMEIAGPDGAPELLDRLIIDLTRVERCIVGATATADTNAIRAETHVLVAVAGAVGAERLQALAEALNAAAHQQDKASIATTGGALLGQIDRLIHFAQQALMHRGQQT